MSPYPLRLEGRLDAPLSRWLWLVKWLLAIPHYVVLCFLWLAFAVVWVIALFAILFTGRFPRGLFDFQAGVLRWTWRVSYYSYSALGTDRYPPFSLGEEPDYPATLHIEHPDHLSRGLVLVKWWLLAIPQYLIVGLFSSIVGALVLAAALVLLFTGRYPAALFDFVMGMNRWTYRVNAYASLMTDRYPPFTFDQGPEEPTGVAPQATRPAPV